MALRKASRGRIGTQRLCRSNSARLRRNGMAQAARKQPETAGSAETSQKDAVRQVLAKVKAEGRASLTAPEGKLVCDAYGIPVPKEGVATSAAEAAKLASDMGFPVVMKIVSPDILHKTEAVASSLASSRPPTPRRATTPFSPTR